MGDNTTCPVCRGVHGGTCTVRHSSSFVRVDCRICGTFDVTDLAFGDIMNASNEGISGLERLAICHQLSTASREDSSIPRITSDWIERFLGDARLPSPATQARNAIRFIGDYVRSSGQKLHSLPIEFFAKIGAASPHFAGDLLSELVDKGLVTGTDATVKGGPKNMRDINLTLDGWEMYEEQLHGRLAGDYGFLALQFGEQELDSFIEKVIKPGVKNGIGYELVDMRDVARAGIIDNLMREQIRDAAFVIADLTHDNSGAYWEAGYAEGLGKPVIYVCEAGKFEDAKTHFDTNHCTTVVWNADEPDGFQKELVATLRRSLNLFD